MAEKLSGQDNLFGRCTTCGRIRLWRVAEVPRGLGSRSAHAPTEIPLFNKVANQYAAMEQEYDRGNKCICANPTALGRSFPGLPNSGGLRRSQNRSNSVSPSSHSEPQQVEPSEPQKSQDLTSDIERLGVLLKSGVLTREQFDAAIKKLLES